MSNIFLPWILLYLTRVYSPGLKKIFGNEKTFAFHSSIRFMSTRIPIPNSYVTEACCDRTRLRKVDHYLITLEMSDMFTSYFIIF